LTLLQKFAKEKARFERTTRGYYLQRGHVALKINKIADFPQEMLDTLFWLRWAGSFDTQDLQESVLLVGPTSYKTKALSFLFPPRGREYSLSRETQVSELIGSCVLRTPESSGHDIKSIVFEVKNKLKDVGIDLRDDNIDD
jgi:hypothetical protein